MAHSILDWMVGKSYSPTAASLLTQQRRNWNFKDREILFLYREINDLDLKKKYSFEAIFS